MPLLIDYATPGTGAVAGYHVTQQVTIDYLKNQTTPCIASYLSQAAYAAGKFPMQTQNIAMAGLPAAGQDALAFAESQLILAVPTPAPALNSNRYIFAGAAIVA